MDAESTRETDLVPLFSFVLVLRLLSIVLFFTIVVPPSVLSEVVMSASELSSSDSVLCEDAVGDDDEELDCSDLALLLAVLALVSGTLLLPPF